MTDLFGRASFASAEDADTDLWQTPQWACEDLVAKYYGDLTRADAVLEPTCGEGHWLDALPAHVPAFGVELRGDIARAARERTGRHVIEGNILDVALPFTPTLIIGNPPFRAKLIDGLLDRAHDWLPSGGRVGMILPSFLMDRVHRVNRERRRWQLLATDTLPRELYPRLKFPIAWVRFEKRSGRNMVGFACFDAMAVVVALNPRAREILNHARTPVWRAVLFDALQERGGEATLEQLYEAIGTRRPTPNVHWREKIRQSCQRYAVRVGRGRWRLPEAA